MKHLITIVSALFLMSATNNQAFISPNGKKYHTHKECQYLKHSEVKVTTIDKAKKDGKTLCSRCKAKDEKGGKK